MTVLVAYASRHGTTAGIAARIAEVLESSGLPAEALPVEEVGDPGDYDAVVVGGRSSTS